MKNTLLFIILAFLLLTIKMEISAAAPTTLSAPPSSSPDGVDFPALSTLDRHDLEAKANQLDRKYRELADQLIAQVRNPSSKNAQLVAIYLLGRYRMEAAIPALSANLDTWDGPVGPITHLSYWSQWPAADALINIGTPAIPEMMHQIAENNNPTVQKLAIIVLRQIQGSDLGRASMTAYLNAHAAEYTAEQQERMRQAIQSITSTQMPVGE